MPNKEKASSSAGSSSRPGSSSPRPSSETGSSRRRLVGGGGGGDSPSRGSVASGDSDDRDMVGGCCVCSDERGWDENPLVYCDGQGCNVAVHQACYGIVSVPQGPWFCRKCETTERSVRVRCELCPSKEGALKRTDSNSWAHVVCALYIPEVRFGNVSTMEPIVLGLVPQERYLKTCYLCESQGRESKASTGACMQCNRQGCKQSFHVTCAQSAGLLCEEAGNYMDNVKYCGYCQYHYQRINKKIVKTIPAFKPIKVRESASSPDVSPEKAHNSRGPGAGSSTDSGEGLTGGSSSGNSVSAGSSGGGSGIPFRSSDKKSKKGRKPILSSSSSGEGGSNSSSGGGGGVKIEAAKLLVDTPSSSSLGRQSSDPGLPKSDEDGGSPAAPWSSSAKPSLWPSSSSSSVGKHDDEARVDGKGDGGGGAASAAEKPPVVLKFGKQDNGTYYKKDVISSSSTSSSASPPASATPSSSAPGTTKKEHRDKNHHHHHHHHHHHKKEKRREASSNHNSPVEADTTSSSNSLGGVTFRTSNTPPSSSATSSSVPQTSSTSSSVSVSVTESAPSSSLSHAVSAAAESSGRLEGGGDAATDLTKKGSSVKVEPMEVDPPTSAEKKLFPGNPDLVISTIKTTSCSVSLDKSKVDLKLLRKSDFKSAAAGSTGQGVDMSDKSSSGSGSAVQLTALPSKTEPSSSSSSSSKDVFGSNRAEADTSSKSGVGGVTITAERASVSDSNATHSYEKSGGVTATGSSLSSSFSSGAVLASPSGVTIEQVSPAKQEDGQQQNLLVSPTTGKMPRMSASGKRIGRPPKKGTHVAANSLGPARPGSPSSAAAGGELAGEAVKRKRKSPHKKPVNGAEHASWMMGASLNPNSDMAKDMNVALEDEIKAHSAYDATKDKHYLGVPFPGGRRQRAPSSQTHSANDILSGGKSQPQTLEELLERQWEQGSQFLMEQASHFDIASLLSSLHQLKEENVDLEDSVDRLVQRRDHLLAVRARLLALSSLSLSSSPPTPERPSAPPGSGGGHHHQNGPSPSSRSAAAAHASPRNSAATVSPVSIQRAGRSSGSAEMAAPLQSPRSHHQPAAPPPQLPPPGAREIPRGSLQMASPRDARVSPRSGLHPTENGLDFVPPPPQHQTLPPHPHMSAAAAAHHHQQQQQQQQAAAAAAAAAMHHQRSRADVQVNDRIMPAHLLTVVSSASGGMPPTRGGVVSTSHAQPPPPRQSSAGYPISVSGGPGHAPPPPPPGGMPIVPSRSVPQPLPPGHHPGAALVRGPPPPPPGMPQHPAHQYPGGGGGGAPPPPPPGSGYQIVSPPPGHAGSMVTLDRSSQQHLRGVPPPPPPQQQHLLRMDKR